MTSTSPNRRILKSKLSKNSDKSHFINNEAKVRLITSKFSNTLTDATVSIVTI